jgi:hypothetical protein
MKSHALLLLSLISGIYAHDAVCGVDVDISGRLVQILDNGEKKYLEDKKITIEDDNIHTDPLTDGNGKFNFNKSNAQLNYGQKIKLTINDDNFFIISPMAGEMFLPNTKINKMDVIVVSKQSRFYHALGEVITGYSIQVTLTHNEGAAIELVRSLRKDNYDAHYDAYPISGIPTNGYFYKVKVKVDTKNEKGAYEGLNKAITTKKSIRKRYGKFDDSFIVIQTEAKNKS